MASTVIDSLVVLLGLDASSYKKGREEAEKETGETARKVKGGADDITKSLAEIGKTIAGLFLGFESVTGFTKFLGNLNAGEAALGRTAANIGMGAHELNRWGNAVELAGGSAADAQAAFLELTNDAEKFFVTGESSNLIKTLQQYGVNLKDSNGQLRNRGEIFEELADKTAVYGRQYQNFLFKQAGLQQGEINYLALSKKERADLLAQAEKENSVTDDSIKQAQELQRYWREVGLAVAAAGQKILLGVTPYVKDAFTWAQKLIDAFKDNGDLTTVSNIFSTIGNTVQAIFNGWKAILDYLNTNRFFKAWDAYVNAFTGLLGKGLAFGANPNSTQTAADAVAAVVSPGYVAPKAGSLAARNNNPGNLRDKWTGKFRTFSTLIEGQSALDSDIDAKIAKGYDTIAKIIARYAPPSENDTTAYINYVSKVVGKGANEQVTHRDTGALIQAITDYESGNRNNVVRGGATAGGNQTTVSVGTIQVNAPQADPRAVAEQVPAAIKRKLTVAQADTGQS